MEKQNVIELIKKSHAWETTEGFIADGIIDPDVYANEKLKILVVLAESYGYDGDGLVEIEDQLEDDILGIGHRNRQTPKKVAVLAWLLLTSIDNGKALQLQEFPHLLETSETNYHILQNTLSRIAYINVKKASRPISAWGNNVTRLDYSEIYNNCARNNEILKLQISSICPDVVIVCSAPVYDAIYDLDLLGEQLELNKKYQVQINEFGQRIIYVSHPSYLPDWGYEGIFETYQIIYRNLLNVQ